MQSVPIAEEHIALVRRALRASDEPDLREVGAHGEIDYLVEDNMTQASVEILDTLIAAEAAGMQRPFAVHNMQKLRDALQPYVGKRSVKLPNYGRTPPGAVGMANVIVSRGVELVRGYRLLIGGEDEQGAGRNVTLHCPTV